MEVTEFFAKFWGLYLIVMAFLMLIRKEQMKSLFTDIVEDKKMAQMCGFFPLFLGFATITLHNQWSMSWEVIITIIGLWATVEGILLIGWPKVIIRMVDNLVEKFYWPGFALSIVLGIYLFYMVGVFDFLT